VERRAAQVAVVAAAVANTGAIRDALTQRLRECDAFDERCRAAVTSSQVAVAEAAHELSVREKAMTQTQTTLAAAEAAATERERDIAAATSALADARLALHADAKQEQDEFAAWSAGRKASVESECETLTKAAVAAAAEVAAAASVTVEQTIKTARVAAETTAAEAEAQLTEVAAAAADRFRRISSREAALAAAEVDVVTRMRQLGTISCNCTVRFN
jgi:hypothetical protein